MRASLSLPKRLFRLGTLIMGGAIFVHREYCYTGTTQTISFSFTARDLLCPFALVSRGDLSRRRIDGKESLCAFQALSCGAAGGFLQEQGIILWKTKVVRGVLNIAEGGALCTGSMGV
jgi:hypothetical protein